MSTGSPDDPILPPPPPPPSPSPGPLLPPSAAGAPTLPPPPPAAAAADAAAGAAGVAEAPTVTLPSVDPAPESTTRSGRRIGAIVGVVALVAAGAFAVVRITGNDSAGGASSPEEVGRLFIASLDDADVLGVVDLLLPGERETMREPVIEMFDNMRRIGVLADDASLSGIGGLDVEFSDIEVVAEPTNVDDIANVVISGTVTASIDGEQVPLGDLIVDDVLDGERPDMSMDQTTEQFDDVGFTVVEQDGRWYMSLFHSIAEQARGDLDIPAEPIALRGSDDPEGAVDDLLTAVQDLDAGALFGVLDPDEFAALQRYAPLFMKDVQQAFDDAGIDWAITDRAYTVDGSGDRRSVVIDSFTLTASIEGDELELRYADSCLTATAGGESFEACVGDVADVTDLLDEAGISDPEPFQKVVDALSAALDGETPAGAIAVHRVDGEWYVSPVRSYFDLLNDFLAELDRDEIVAIVDSLEELGASVDEELSLPGLDDVTVDGTDDDVTDDGGDDWDSSPSYAAVDDCHLTGNGDAAVVVECLQNGLDAGVIDPFDVAAPVRFPECGVAELYVFGEVYDLDDASFVAAVTEATPCFLDLIAAGAVDSFEVPYEVIAPECLEGRNWYTSDDEEANSAFFECAEAVRLSL